MIQKSIARNKRYNASQLSLPVERVATMHPHKPSTNRSTKSWRLLRSRICGGWWQRNGPAPLWEGRGYATQARRSVPPTRITGSLLHPHRPIQIQRHVVDVHRSRGRKSRWQDQEARRTYRTQDLRPAPTDTGQLRDAGPSTRTYGCASRQAQICGGATPTRRFGKCCPHAGNTNPCHHEFGH